MFLYFCSDINNEISTMIANNMGVIHLRVRHYAIAAKFFQHSIMFDRIVASNLRIIDLYKMSTVHSCEILYNLGIAMLHLRRPSDAFHSLLAPLKTYHNNPRLWFRIAEACIMEHDLVVYNLLKILLNFILLMLFYFYYVIFNRNIKT